MTSRDSAVTTLILGVFASSWFGWAQERPPASWRLPLIAGAVVSIVAAAVGAILARRFWPTGSSLAEPGARQRYGIIVGVEFGVAAVGAAGIALGGHADYTAPWICLVVGVHFVPMAPVLRNPSLIALGALLVVVAIVAVLVSRRTDLIPSALAGAGAGTLLLGFAVWSAVSTLIGEV